MVNRDKINIKLKNLGWERLVKFDRLSTNIAQEIYKKNGKYVVFDYIEGEYYTNMKTLYLLLRPRLLYWLVEKLDSMGGLT